MRRTLQLPLLVMCAILCFTLPVWSKTVRNYYSDQRLATMRQNLAQSEWAQQQRDRILAEADKWAAYDDDRLLILVPPPDVPRAVRLNPDDCPIHGQKILEVGGYNSWKMDFDHPYKITCPIGGETYPSNDFLAYLQGGKQDKALLIGPYADDGWGWQKNPGDKSKYWFVAYYAHQMVRNWLLPALTNLSRAYVITGDPKYAHKAGLLLWQLAQYYPDYNYETQSSYGLEVDHQYYGRLMYHTWETWTVEEAAKAYDAVFPNMAQDTELQKRSGKSGAEVCRDIEERLLRTMARDITDGSHRIQGNYGMHQNAALLVALVLDDKQGSPSSQDIVNWVLNNPVPAELYTDSAFFDMLTNLLHRDGIPFESPGYNCGWMTDLAAVAELLKANGVDLWKDARFRSIYTAPLDQLVLGKFTTSLGDSNNMFGGALGTTAPYQQKAWENMRNPRQAQAMAQSNAGYLRDLFEADGRAEIEKQAQEYGKEVGVESSLLPGLGNLTLQTGTGANRTGLSLYYGYYVGHIHFDLLNVDFYAQGQPLTPDLGYPETADTGDPRRFGFLSHTVVHNTCMVNAQRQELGRGQLVAFHPGQFAQMAEVTDVKAYPDTVKDYRRTVLLVDAPDGQAYYVDIFRVSGGHQHDWLVHGTDAAFSSSLPLSEPRQEGTLAGPDVPYGHFYDDEALKESKYGLYYYNYKGSAFQWLYNVQQASLKGTEPDAPYVQWTMNRDPNLFPKEYPRGAVLRSYLVPNAETVFACDGTPQRRVQFPEKLKWVVRRRTAPDENLQSTFVTVHEGYKENEIVKAVRRLPVTPASPDAVAIEVDLGTRKDIVFSSRDLQQTYTIDGKLKVTGRAAVVALDAAGNPVRARLFDGTALTCGQTTLTSNGLRTAQIKSLDYAQGIVTLDQPCLKQTDVGRWVPVTSASHEASVRIEQVLAPDKFSCTGQDLRAARGLPLALEGNTISTNALCYFAEPGMTVVNEAFRPLTRLVAAKGLKLEIATPVQASDFVDVDRDGKGRFFVMVAGPGDTVQIGSDAMSGQ